MGNVCLPMEPVTVVGTDTVKGVRRSSVKPPSTSGEHTESTKQDSPTSSRSAVSASSSPTNQTKKKRPSSRNNSSLRKLSFKWTEEYMLGVLFVDRQHKRLVELIIDLSASKRKQSKKGVERWQVGHILDELVQYTKIHFKDEEHLMELYQYPYTKAHKKVHADFMQKVGASRDQFLNHDDSKIAEDILFFLQEWLVSHILNIDKRLVDHVLEKDPDLEKLKGASALAHI